MRTAPETVDPRDADAASGHDGAPAAVSDACASAHADACAAAAPRAISVICIGNEWQLDDGFGPAVARYLTERYAFPAGVSVLDRGVMGYAIVPDLMACDVAIVVDALDETGSAPGTLFSFDPEDMAGAAGMMSLHEVRFADVLASARFLGAACEGHCFGVQVADRGAGALERGLAAPVAAAVPLCARTVVRYLRERYGVRAHDRWAATADPRAQLDDPAAYVRGALAGAVADDALARALAQVRPGLPDYAADELIARALDGGRGSRQA